MQTITRRSILSSIVKTATLAAAGPLLSTTVGCDSDSIEDRRLTLNLVLHGLFVLHFKDTHIELLTPEVHDHIYRAGNWDFNQTYGLNKGDEYALRGVKHMPSAPIITSSCNVEYSEEKFKFTVHPEKSYLKVWLPFPEELKLLRCSPDHKELYKSACKDQNEPGTEPVNNLSLCQVLIYRVPDYRELALAGTKWKPKIDRSTYTANLHLWAEPENRLTPCHALAAYSKLDELLDPLHLRLGFYSTVPLDRDTGVWGLPPEQEQGWSDWASGGGEGAYPTNCCAVMVRK
jgi:hypothetical protein